MRHFAFEEFLPEKAPPFGALPASNMAGSPAALPHATDTVPASVEDEPVAGLPDSLVFGKVCDSPLMESICTLFGLLFGMTCGALLGELPGMLFGGCVGLLCGCLLCRIAADAGND